MKQVALRAGKPYYWVNARIHGRSPIYADDIYLLAKGLQRDPCDFFRDEVEPAPIPSREDREADPSYIDQDVITRDWAERLLSLPARDVELLVNFLELQRSQEAPSAP